MIIHDFNNGWGENFQLRKFEKKILRRYLQDWYEDDTPSVTVNSTWYSQQYHDLVLQFLTHNYIDRIAVYSFMDPAIPDQGWFKDLDIETRFIGYYAGKDEIDLWALIMDSYFEIPEFQSYLACLDTAFICYNRKPHWHRLRLVQQLKKLGCLGYGVVTMGNRSEQVDLQTNGVVDPILLAPNPGPEQYGIANDIMSIGPKDTWMRCFLNLVTETVFDVDTQWFVSEKIYKPVVGLKPFLVYAPNGARNWLHHVGIQDFVNDFHDITDLDLADPAHIPTFIYQLGQQDSDYFRHKYRELQEKIHHNRNMFHAHVKMIKHKVKM